MKRFRRSRLARPGLAALTLLAGLAAACGASARERVDARGSDAARGFTPLVAPTEARGSVARAARRQADERVARALDALLGAERALRHGRQPLPGERRHLVDGYSRLTSAYFERLQALQTAVEHARGALQSAYAARDALTS
jgi:hypothetical protein